MEQSVVDRVKRGLAVAWLSATGFTLVASGPMAAAVAGLTFAGVGVLAATAFVLWLLLGDGPVAWRILMIALFLIGLVVEFGALVSALEWLLTGVSS